MAVFVNGLAFYTLTRTLPKVLLPKHGSEHSVAPEGSLVRYGAAVLFGGPPTVARLLSSTGITTVPANSCAHIGMTLILVSC